MFDPAFLYLRKFNDVSAETEDLVCKRISGRVSSSELIKCFENGIAGEYGKVYKADPETIMMWVKKFINNKVSAKNYLDSGLIPVSVNGVYVSDLTDWMKETNKCYMAFVSGVSEEYFHHYVYKCLVTDDRIKKEDYQRYYKFNPFEFEQNGFVETEEMKSAMRKSVRDYFANCKAKGFDKIYFV